MRVTEREESWGFDGGDDGREHGYFTASDGVKLHYVRLGDAGSWVVLIHGYTGSAEGNWFANGIAQALAEGHRVVAIDCRNHGKSDKPEPGGPGNAEDVVELMNHLGIERAHIHGYSMGGMLTGRLLTLIPDRMITAGFGGSGVREADEDLAKLVPDDSDSVDPEEAVASRNLRKVAIPVLAINGEYLRPLAKTHRLWRELHDFTNVVLPGKSHLTAIVAGYMPPDYLKATVRFIDSNDEPAAL